MALRSDCSQIGQLVRLAVASILGSGFLLANTPAEAHHYRHYHLHPRVARAAQYPRLAHRERGHYVREAAAAVSGSPAFSAIVIDANSGQTLYSADENGLRHPASITKVMTLYLLFERLDQGAMTLRTQIPISEHAAAQEPSKLGLSPGGTISVEDAIKAVVTRSANDVAVAIAEAIGQTEDNFADMMTRKARELGMSSTLYRNASGLPNDQQVTTAHDLTILGRALEDRFPRYFRYFSTAEFEYDGQVIGNHNHLLGRVEGVDGIKTGYTRASGFNLLTSVHREGRSLIAVVMGGRSAGARDRIMENLIADHLAEASTARTATMIAEVAPAEKTDARAEPREAPAARPRTAAEPMRVADQDAEGTAGEGDNADGDDVPAAQGASAEATAPRPAAAMAYASAGAPERAPADAGRVESPSGAAQKEQRSDRPAPASATLLPPERSRGPDLNSHQKHQRAFSQTTTVARAQLQTPEQSEDRGRGGGWPAHGSWMIQIGATDDPSKASALLSRARERNPSTLAAARPVTETVRRGDATLYRARFAVLDSSSAESACRSLKRSGFSCFPAHD
jgi:D-alanyl-D-alanine carboxypeptidase